MAASRENLWGDGCSRKFKKSLLLLVVILLLFTMSSLAIMLYPNSPSNLFSEPLSTLKVWCISYGLVQCCGYCLLMRMHRRDADLDSSFNKQNTAKGPFEPLSLVYATVTLVKAGFYFLLSYITFHVISVLYGAPVTETVEETAMFAVLLSTLVTVPALCIFGPDSDKIGSLIRSQHPQPGLETCLAYFAVFSLFGAWLGAFPIPLDWDRPWQKWPISCSIGALLGHTLSLAASVIHCWRRLDEHPSSSSSYLRSKSKNY